MAGARRRAKVKGDDLGHGIDISALDEALRKAIRDLVPWSVTWDRSLVQAVSETCDAGRLRVADINLDEADPEAHVVFDDREFFREHAQAVVSRLVPTGATVGSELAVMSREYQDRMANGSDDPMRFVEDSDVLRFFKAQEAYGRAVEFDLDVTRPATWTSMFAAVERMAESYRHRVQPEELILAQAVRTSLAKLVPMLAHARAIVLGPDDGRTVQAEVRDDLSPDEAAVLVGMSVAMLLRRTRAGDVPHRTVEGLPLYGSAGIAEFMKEETARSETSTEFGENTDDLSTRYGP